MHTVNPLKSALDRPMNHEFLGFTVAGIAVAGTHVCRASDANREETVKEPVASIQGSGPDACHRASIRRVAG